MNDFYAQLEHELVEAGRRRAQRPRWRIALAGRGRLLLAVATVLLAGVAAAASISLLGSGSSASAPAGGGVPPAPPAADSPTVSATPAPEREQLPSRPLRGTRVAVYNGTTSAGVARTAAQRLAAQGATIGSVGNAVDQAQTRTVVGHRPGAGAQGRIVATILGVRDIHPWTDDEALMARGGADVVVQVGSDRSRP